MLHKHTVTVSAQKAVNFYREIGRRERPSGILLFWIAEVPSVCPWPVSTERILCSSRFLFLDLPKQTLLLVAIPLSPVLCPVCCTSGTSSFPLPSFSYALFWETLTYILLHVCFHCCSRGGLTATVASRCDISAGLWITSCLLFKMAMEFSHSGAVDVANKLTWSILCQLECRAFFIVPKTPVVLWFCAMD